MTDPTTRYPLPDEPGQDPLVAPGTSTDPLPPAAPAAPEAGSTSTREGTFGAAPSPPPPTAAPAWTPPRDERTSWDGGRWPAVAFGLILLAVGLWLFADVTLGLDLPTIRWGQLWPIALIVVGALILYGSRIGRRR